MIDFINFLVIVTALVSLIYSPMTTAFFVLAFIIWRFVVYTFLFRKRTPVNLALLAICGLSTLLALRAGTPEIVGHLLSRWNDQAFWEFWLKRTNDPLAWALASFAMIWSVNVSVPASDKMLERNEQKLDKRFSSKFTPPYGANLHQLIVGTTGAGKTSYVNDLLNYNQDDSIIIIDGKADTGEYSLLDNAKKLAERTNRQLVVLNGTTNPEYDGWAFNPFLSCDVTQAKDLMMCLITDDKVRVSSGSEHYKTMFEAYLLACLQLMEALGIECSFNNILDCLDVEKKGEDLLEMSAQMDLTSDQRKVVAQSYDEMKRNYKDALASITKLNIFRQGRGRFIFNQNGAKTFNAEMVCKRGAVLVVLVDEMSMPEYSQGLAKMVIQDVRNYVSKRITNPGEREKQVRLVMDEFSSYGNKTQLALLAKGRSAGLTCYLSTQSMGDLSALGDEFQQAVIENINQFVVFRQNSPQSAEMVADIIGTRQTVTQTERSSGSLATGEASNTLAREYLVNPDEIKALEKHTAYFVDKDAGTVNVFTNQWAKKKGLFARFQAILKK